MSSITAEFRPPTARPLLLFFLVLALALALLSKPSLAVAVAERKPAERPTEARKPPRTTRPIVHVEKRPAIPTPSVAVTRPTSSSRSSATSSSVREASSSSSSSTHLPTSISTTSIEAFSLSPTTVSSLTTPSSLPSSLATTGPANPGPNSTNNSSSFPIIVGGAGLSVLIVGSCLICIVRRRRLKAISRMSSVGSESTRPMIGKPLLTKQPSFSGLHSPEPSDATAQTIEKPPPTYRRVSTANQELLSSGGGIGVSEAMSQQNYADYNTHKLYPSYPEDMQYPDPASPIDPDQQLAQNMPLPDGAEPNITEFSQAEESEPLSTRPQTDFYDFMDTAYTDPPLDEYQPPVPYHNDQRLPDSPMVFAAKKLHQTMILPPETTAQTLPLSSVEASLPPLPPLPQQQHSGMTLTSQYTPPPLPLPPGVSDYFPANDMAPNYPVPRANPPYNPPQAPTNGYGPPPTNHLPPAPASTHQRKPSDSRLDQQERPDTMAMVGRFGGPLAQEWRGGGN